MKRIITILAIMVVLVGTVFADATSTGAASLKITTTITADEPTFKLSTTQVSSDLAAQTAQAAAAAALAGDSAHNIENDALLSANQTVKFTVTQVAKSRSTTMYTFTAAATNLELYEYQNASGNWIQTATTAHPAADADKRFVVSAATVDTFAVPTVNEAPAGLTATQATYGGTASAKTITYLGSSVAANTDVLEFTCTWQQNADAVPGHYRATVTLTVATN